MVSQPNDGVVKDGSAKLMSTVDRTVSNRGSEDLEDLMINEWRSHHTAETKVSY